MRTTEHTQIEAFANERLAHFGLTAKGWSFEWNSRKRAYGLCSKRKKKIFLSTFLFSSIDDAARKDTVLHEIAHALDFDDRGTSDHGRIWKRWALHVGAEPTRCKTPVNEEAYIENRKAKAKYTLRCASGHEFFRSRKLKNNVKASCPKCAPAYNRRYNPDFALQVIQNY